MKRIAFLSFDWDYEIIPEYYDGVREYLGDRDDVQVVIFSAFGHYYASHLPKKNYLELFKLCKLSDYDGVLIQGNRTWPPELRQQLVNEAIALGMPVVSINYDLAGAHSVGTDNYREEYELVTKVIKDHSCKRPAFVNGLKTSIEAQARAQGFRDACADLGIENAQFIQANWQREAGVVSAKKMLRKPNDLPDVVFCCNDDLAVGVMETLYDAGVNIPEQVMITGFDYRAVGELAPVRLTTIDRDYRTIAVTAIDALLRLLEGEELPEHLYSPARHVLAESCRYSLDEDAAELQERLSLDASLKRFYEVLVDYQASILGNDSLYSIFENCERFASSLGCANVYLSLNGNYMDPAGRLDPTCYGDTSFLVARNGRSFAMRCDEQHVYTSFASSSILPPQAPFDRDLYMLFPLYHNELIIGMLATEGVPTVLRHGFLSFFLSMLAAAIESARKSKLLERLPKLT